MAETTPVRAEDLVSVGTRVSWGSIIAGAVVALALYLVLTLLGGAIGLSIRDNVRTRTLEIGAALWAVLTIATVLFVGGWATSQLVVGENRMEAMVHGVILWGVVFAMLLWMMASGIRAGFNAMVGMANVTVAANQTIAGDWETLARRAGVTQKQIDQWKLDTSNTAANVRQTVENAPTAEEAARKATAATWWTLLGIVLSMATAIGGAWVGCGPEFRLVVRHDNYVGTGGIVQGRV